MSLPKIDAPTFEMKLISNNRDIRYRPFLVKEEKLLLMAMEGGETQDVINASKQIVNNCILDEIDIDTLPLFDVQYALLKIRSKSIGEIAEVMVKHINDINEKGEECKASTKVEVDVSSIVPVISENHSNMIRVTNDIGIQMKYPTIKLYEKLGQMTENDNTNVEGFFDIILDCIDSIFQGNEVFNASDHSKEEMSDFLNSLTNEQFQKIQEFFNTMPNLNHDINFVCKACGCNETLTLNGLNDFFLS